MTEPLLNTGEERLLIFVLAAMLLMISLLGLWLCRQLRRAYDRLYRRQREETVVLLAHPDHRRARGQTVPIVPPEVVALPDAEFSARQVAAAPADQTASSPDLAG